jgi:hypothetical protein
MTDLRKAAEMALEALEGLQTWSNSWLKFTDEIQALRQALAQPEQEPVAWMFVNEDGECEQIEYGPVFDDPGVTPLYTAPPKKQWVSLTDQEVWQAIDNVLEGGGWLDVARVLEQAFKEKNT